MIWTTKAINDSVTIVSGTNDELAIRVDGVDRTVVIPSGDYYTNYNKHESRLIEAVNQELEDSSIPVIAKLGGMFGQDDATVRKSVVVLEHKTGGTLILTGGSFESVLY